MKRFDIHTIVMLALLAGVASTTTPALAASKCDTPNGMIEQRACAKAAAGAEDLRRFVERTRAIYGLYYYDFANGDGRSRADAIDARRGLTSPKP